MILMMYLTYVSKMLEKAKAQLGEGSVSLVVNDKDALAFFQPWFYEDQLAVDGAVNRIGDILLLMDNQGSEQ